MKTIKTELSISSLDKLLSSIEQYKEKVSSLEHSLPQGLAKKAEKYISINISEILDKDGNIDVGVGTYAFGDTALAFISGTQAAYIEYGTGINGKNEPHPLATDIGWDYMTGQRIFKTKDGRIGWVYKNPLTGKYHFTEGIPSGRVVFNAANQIRREVSETAKELLK